MMNMSSHFFLVYLLQCGDDIFNLLEVLHVRSRCFVWFLVRFSKLLRLQVKSSLNLFFITLKTKSHNITQFRIREYML